MTMRCDANAYVLRFDQYSYRFLCGWAMRKVCVMVSRTSRASRARRIGVRLREVIDAGITRQCGWFARFKCGLPRRGVMPGSIVDSATRQASTSRSRLGAFDRVVRTALDAWKRRVKRCKSLKIGQHRGDSFFLWISWHSVRGRSISEQFVSFDGKRRASNRLQPGPSHSRRRIR